MSTTNTQAVLPVARMMGIHPAQARHLPELLAGRDTLDARRLCLECTHLDARAGCCCNPIRAGLARSGRSTAPLGPDFVTLLQHCPGFAQRQH